MIYGELFAAEIDPHCGDKDEPVCVPGRWLNPLLMTCYLLVANILLLNLLIAVFNSIFVNAHTFSHQIWKFNRFGVVMEYEQKPALPPPLIIFSHMLQIVKWCRRCTKGPILFIALSIYFITYYHLPILPIGCSLVVSVTASHQSGPGSNPTINLKLNFFFFFITSFIHYLFMI